MNATSIARLLLAAGLVGAAISISMIGGEAVPLWVVGLGSGLEVSPEVGAKIIVGSCAALGGMLACLGGRGRIPAIIVAAALAFSGLADVSALFALGDEATVGFLRPLLQLGFGIPILVVLLRGTTDRAPSRHPGLTGFGAIGSLVIGAAVAANVTVAMPESFRTSGSGSGRGADGRFIVNDLTAADWTGMPLAETGLLDHLPALGPLTQDQPTLISFYRPNCGLCHDLFDKSFGERLPVRIIAIRVPPAEGVEMVESDLPEDVVCPDCVRLALPEGPVWLVTSPVVIEVVDGVVTCVSENDFERCIDDAISRTNTTISARGPLEG
jgi:hypothetical protein